MVHYLSAGMLGSVEKRAEEAQFFDDFDTGFARRHHDAFLTIAKRLELEYVGVDCAETPDGELLIFEIDSAMTVHAMDPVEIYPYKPPQMGKVFEAFRQMLISRMLPARGPAGTTSDHQVVSAAGALHKDKKSSHQCGEVRGPPSNPGTTNTKLWRFSTSRDLFISRMLLLSGGCPA
jgi:hypothetical protein